MAPRRLTGARPAGLSCVVADHDRIDRLLARTALELAGFRNIVEAGTGDQLREILHRQEADLVLVSADMGETSGLEFTRRVRWEEEWADPEMVILLLAGHKMPAALPAARNAGADSLIRKPFSARKLSATTLDTLAHLRPFVRAETYRGPCRRITRQQVAADRRGDAAAYLM